MHNNQLSISDKSMAFEKYSTSTKANILIETAFKYWELQRFCDACGRPIHKKYLCRGLNAIFKSKKLKLTKQNLAK